MKLADGAVIEAGVGADDRFAPDATLPTVSLMGLNVAVVSEQQTVDHVLRELSNGRGGWICTANLDILRQWKRSAEARQLVSQVDMVVADGMPLVWASIVQRTPLPERVAGSTLTLTLTSAAAAAGASVFLLGGNPGTAAAAGRRLKDLNPGLELAGTLCPPRGFEREPALLAEIDRRLSEAAPDIVYVGLGFPKQERLIASLRTLLPNAWFVGCGVTFSFVSGELERAPAAVQRLGLEWTYRVVQEPGRLWRRYLLAGVPFLVELMSHSLATRWGEPVRLETTSLDA
jgi:N-acetylglucosaminyldiphosphoundecaprenol N-acetyl-beta-D-mannosaminyltransferase